jgi:hypothetical protein
MKKLLLMVVFVAQLGFGQEIKHSDLATTNSRGEFTSYVGSDGGIYKIGDRIKIGVPSSNKTFAYISINMFTIFFLDDFSIDMV